MEAQRKDNIVSLRAHVAIRRYLLAHYKGGNALRLKGEELKLSNPNVSKYLLMRESFMDMSDDDLLVLADNNLPLYEKLKMGKKLFENLENFREQTNNVSTRLVNCAFSCVYWLCDWYYYLESFFWGVYVPNISEYSSNINGSIFSELKNVEERLVGTKFDSDKYKNFINGGNDYVNDLSLHELLELVDFLFVE